MVLELVADMVVTGCRAAPLLLSQRNIAPTDEGKLTAVFDCFYRWHLAGR
jgi:hypothetical protein